MATAEYRVYVDWDNDNNLTVGDFEVGNDDWFPFGDTPPVIGLTSEESFTGRHSLEILWPSQVSGGAPLPTFMQFDTPGAGFSDGMFAPSANPIPDPVDGPPVVRRTITNLTPGTEYTAYLHVFTVGGSISARLNMDTADSSPWTTLSDEWEELTVTFTATASTHDIWLEVDGDPSGFAPGGEVVATRNSTTDQELFGPDSESGVLAIGDSARLFDSGGSLKETTYFTVQGVESIGGGEIRVTFTPNAAVNPAAGDRLRLWKADRHFIDQARVLTGTEEVTEDILHTTAISYRRGRDNHRSLSAISPGETAFDLLNTTRKYSPENPDSPVGNNLKPGRPVLITAAFGGKVYNQFQGYLDQYSVNPVIGERMASFTAIDLLGRMGEFVLSTPLYNSIQTGEALHLILDEMGWSRDMRKIDHGATTMRYWWEDGTTALESVHRIVDSEGIGSFAYVDVYGNFIFRSRHHRVMDQESLTPQAYFTGEEGGAEPQISAPFVYDISWKDIVNTIDTSVEERRPEPLDVVWEEDSPFVLAGNETRTISLKTSDPFYGAIAPVEGVDYLVTSGNVITSLSRTSGQSLEIKVRAIGGPASVLFMKLRAILVPVSKEYKVRIEDAASVKDHGSRAYSEEMPYAGIHDVIAIADMVLGRRAERLPTVSFTLNNGTPERLEQILTRELSDRIHITEPETFVDSDFYIETINNTISSAGHYHEATFGCERVAEQVNNVFTFDDPDAGFDDGNFGRSGIDNPGSLFILGDSRLGEGQLGH